MTDGPLYMNINSEYKILTNSNLKPIIFYINADNLAKYDKTLFIKFSNTNLDSLDFSISSELMLDNENDEK